MGLRNH